MSGASRLHLLLDRREEEEVARDLLGRRCDDSGRLSRNPLSDAYRAELRAGLRRDQAALGDIAVETLKSPDDLARAVLEYSTLRCVEQLDTGVFDLQRMIPLEPNFGLLVGFPDYLAGGKAALSTSEAAEDCIGRLDDFAAYLVSIEQRMREGAAAGVLHCKVVVEATIAQLRAMLATEPRCSAFHAPARADPNALDERVGAAFLERIETLVFPRIASLLDYLSSSYLPAALDAPGRWAMKHGEMVYAWELESHLTKRIAPAEIHETGLAEVADLRGRMEALRKEIGFGGSLRDLFDHVREDPRYYYREPAELLAHFGRIVDRIRVGMPHSFHRQPRASFEVRPLPAFAENRGTGYYEPGEADGSRPGILYFNMAMLATRPIPTLETLTLHEGIPGHHLQLMLAREDSRLPAVLQSDKFTAYVEGWALYCESIGRELGLFTDPMQWFGHLDMAMLRAARLVVDTGIHALRWDRSRAIDFLIENTSMAPRDAAGEIDRYIAVPGQACAYKIGELEIRRQREASELAFGPAFDVAEFHDQVVSTGALPLDLLAQKLALWRDRSVDRVSPQKTA